MFVLPTKMSQLIKSRKAVTTAPCPIPPPSISVAIAPAYMEPIPINSVVAVDAVVPQSSQALASSASSVALPAVKPGVVTVALA
ncbi:hypothetical protein C1H46_044303 [Malus baccata]|uniref:Uncharacterized protein n=1 Tax=Malus baccata TaxID=106549 RepID=A0A540K7G8_MALBA|nr:hypothetical protein C1H46_044303 [Malus baccata]